MRSWQLYGIAALLWAAIFLPGLGTPELKGEEGRRILPARTMLRTGEWIVPFSEGKPYSRKPPMINWMIAACFKVTGIENEWTARLPSVLAVLAGTLVVLWASRRVTGDSGAIVAALSFLACAAQIDKGRLAEIEALYVTLTAIALAMWLRFWHREANPWLTYTVPWIFIGLAMLSKGPVHLIFVYGILFAILLDARRLRELVQLPHLAGIGIMCSIFLPWAILNAQRSAAIAPSLDSAQTVWLTQLTARLDPSALDWGSYALVPFQGVVNFAPWILFVILFWRKIGPWSQGEADQRIGSIVRGLKWGMLVTFLIVSLIPESRPRFTMPLFGAAAILTGWIASRAWQRHQETIQPWWERIVRGLACVLAVAAIVIPLILKTWVGALPIGIGVAIVLYFFQRRRMETLQQLAIGTTLVIAAGVILVATDTRHLQHERENVRPLGRAITNALPQDAKLTIFKPSPQPFLFYIDQDYTIADRPSNIPPETEHLLLRPEHYERVLKRKSIASRGEPEVLDEFTARDGKRYRLIQLP